MIENFDWNQFIFFPEDSSNEEYLCVDNNVVNTPDEVSEFVVPESLRLLGYYNKPNQKMNPETVKVREAQQIYDLLTKSFENYTCQGEEYSEIINVFETAIFVFKDSKALFSCSRFKVFSFILPSSPRYDNIFSTNILENFNNFS